MSAEVEQLIEFATQDLVAEIVEHEGLSTEAAMDKLYHSAFFRQLNDPDSGLYHDGGEYLYQSMLNAH